ncbi:Avirulence protein (Avh) [Phytophthora palmivora]|uniref:RxLR effector protein n=1 Tax=Phytophthora palmivora TaxID=4796 RepID=A0A2P4Y905_9STRA|nr:Avirulence protein (Avh) [Phytophthora palmivora]
MRALCILLATATIFLACSDIASSASASKLSAVGDVYSTKTDDIASTHKRVLRGFERIIQQPIKLNTPGKIDKILGVKKLDELLDPARADALLAKNKLGGWIEKATLDKVRSGTLDEKKEVLSSWRRSKLTPEELTKFIKADPSIEKKYMYVAKLYEGYLKKQPNTVSGFKRKRGEI